MPRPGAEAHFIQGLCGRSSGWEVNQGPAAACSSLLLLYSLTQRLCWCLGWALPPLILSNTLEFNSGIHPETLERRRDAQHTPFPPAMPELSFVGALSEANALHPK